MEGGGGAGRGGGENAACAHGPLLTHEYNCTVPFHKVVCGPKTYCFALQHRRLGTSVLHVWWVALIDTCRFILSWSKTIAHYGKPKV